MIRIGKNNLMQVVKILHFGAYLDGEDFGEILLPKKYVPMDLQPEDFIDVFLYMDSDDRPVATTLKPYAQVGEFAFLRVAAVETTGAFLDWGLPKDLLVPYREQKQRLIKNRSYLVYVYLDTDTDRIAASTKIEKFLDLSPAEYEKGEEVQLIISGQTELGYTAIINHKHRGLLFENDVFRDLKKGERLTGFVKNIRADKKIDLTLQRPGYEKIDALSSQILEALQANKGFLAVNDNSSPEVIYSKFGISKKNFKKAVGALFKKRLIRIEDKGIKLLKK